MAEDRHSRDHHWIEPERRGILPLDAFHVPRSLRKAIRRGRLRDPRRHRLRAHVIRACAAPMLARPQTWLNDELIELYVELHRRGYAHSVETWQAGELVGGLYGVALGRRVLRREHVLARAATPARSPWSTWSTACAAAASCCWTPSSSPTTCSSFGAIEISRPAYRTLLRRALARRCATSRATGLPVGRRRLRRAAWGRPGAGTSGSGSSGSAQSTTQTS